MTPTPASAPNAVLGPARVHEQRLQSAQEKKLVLIGKKVFVDALSMLIFEVN